MKTLILIVSLWSIAHAQPQGVWVRPCSDGNIQIQTFEGQNTFTDEIFFQDLKCSKPLMSFSYDGVSAFEPVEMIYEFRKVAVTLYEPNQIQDFNRRAVCGFRDWSSNKPKTITGLRCAFFQQSRPGLVPSLGEKRFGIWKIQSGRLSFGKLTPTHPGTTPETRPVEWDPRVYFRQL